MVDPKAVDWKKAYKRRTSQRTNMSCTPARWRRFLAAGTATGYCIKALAQFARQTQTREDDDDST
ncbi:hypothetical protein KKG90_10480 [Candidatus Bipolaricaulota bacterium]|nr:hypothetical protein [Candidatus Bipolaricaulota bacterium]